MGSRIVGGVALLFALTATSLFLLSGPVGPHDYDVTITGNQSTGYIVEKGPGVFFFEVDYGHDTTWTFTNKADEDVDLQFDEASFAGGRCHVVFSPRGTVFCESSRITVPNNGTPVVLQATGADLWPWEYSNIAGLYRSDLRVGPVGGLLVPKDPELEIERDNFLSALTAAVLSLALFGVAWRLRRRARTV